MQEIIYTKEERAVHRERKAQIRGCAESSVVLYLKAQGSKCAVAPEIEAACNLKVGVVGRNNGVALAVVVIVIDEEGSVSPVILMETLQSGVEVLSAKVVESLESGLRNLVAKEDLIL